ncbi:unnamed protein product [Mytilus coruscus]|uniref:ZMYM2-like/QRICH1 C-terminal domain-containing protein n=1 Tax=Mytilus coruscus TaxID=42192 RepID=A0A6J8E234_MYTCO|nr:unnamed protein product [Mytilus coruscus]
MATPLQIGITVEHCGEKYRLVNHEKPNPNFARHYIIQSFSTGVVKKAFRHELYEIPALSSTITTKPVVSEPEEHFSQSDNELFDVEIETEPPHYQPINPTNKTVRFKSAPTEEMTYNESNKTHHGIDSRENSQEQRMYANHENTAICPVASLDLYLGKLSNKYDSLFQQPLQYPKANLWYAAQPVGKNKLAGMMSVYQVQPGYQNGIPITALR